MLDDADLVIVLQSHSHQYQRAVIDALIGRTIFGRLICCYGAWCESDGRTRDLWPDAVRISSRLAPAFLARELRDCDAGEPALPPTAARDEIFADRLEVAEDRQPPAVVGDLNVAIVGPDRVFRRAVSQNLAEAGGRSLNIPFIQIPVGQSVPVRETSRGPVHLVIHDLAPWGPVAEASLTAARTMFPAAAVWDIATMPDAGLATGIADCGLECIIPKLDMQLGLLWHLHQWKTAEDGGLYQYLNAS